MKKPLSLFDNNPHIWRGKQQPADNARLSFGIPALDNALNGGVPAAGVIRIASATGIGELSLFSELLTRQKSQKLCVFIKPPAQLQADWLLAQGYELDKIHVVTPSCDNDALWAAEQCLKSTACHCVYLWQNTLSYKQARRLQVAATQSDTLCILFTPEQQSTPLPINVDLSLSMKDSLLNISIRKQRHGWPVNNVKFPRHWTPDNSSIQYAMRTYRYVPEEQHHIVS
ncbi:translesion DNA synthesis-associated protein ImuA [Alteromonas sp. KUL49]|uniref:translesion DNA synthesis-associated protein ImuA n=1 Tax=Alteromonas sp. KUL49 TaxID=2480798 RepID=UPI00102EF083|nr:translesion DNA synthesis-associated protein ImuA [Alteromonas sp. KUL49]TAP34260.1 translesion DNA synthesis-associated protein ImuA [Alteromonas sp. KUL49]GEA13560.1 recombinase RecA [Alteromonas sp. KUL49]